jgi:hypothetical protein
MPVGVMNVSIVLMKNQDNMIESSIPFRKGPNMKLTHVACNVSRQTLSANDCLAKNQCYDEV